MSSFAETSVRRPHRLAAASPPPALSLHGLARFCVLVAVAASGVVFSEPAPVDLLMLGLIVLLPLARLQRYAPGMMLQTMIWLVCGAGALIAASISRDVGDSAIHTFISFYLYAAFLVLAAFVALDPERHSRLILRGWVIGALVAAGAGLVGYFHLLPGAHELFTRFGRASGTFKDPNVLGPFLVPAILYLAHRILSGETRTALLDLGGLALLVLGVLLSFSRGAWFNLVVAAAVYGGLLYVTTASAWARMRIVLLVMIGLLLAGGALLAALQTEAIGTLLAQRSTLTHSYDVGPQGRFGGQAKALGLMFNYPLGLGAKQFAAYYHPEDVHNVYISMFLNAGWLGGLAYLAAVVTTCVAGLVHLLRGTASRPLFLIAFAAFVANVAEGFVIDTDHWRHFYVLLALIWGMIGAAHPSSPRESNR